MFKRTTIAFAVAALALAGTAQAQVNATLVLKSGDRVTGDLVDYNGRVFGMRVNGQDREIAGNDVAVVDFGDGNIANIDWSKIQSGQHLVFLKSGETVSGEFYDIAGRTPLNIIIKTANGERKLTSNEISRIALGRPNNAVATSGTSAQAPEGQGIAVPGNQQWVATGITVRRGESIRVNATGEVQLSTDAADIASAYGSKAQKYAANAPLPRTFAGALIGRIGENGQPFPIGTDTTVTMPAAGQLFLGINDDHVGDNQGGFRVQITRSGRR